MDCDKTGIGVSLLCLIHCVALPLIAVLYPSFAHSEGEGLIHAVLAMLVLSLGAVAFSRGYQKHKNACPALLAVTGFSALMIGLFVHVDIPFFHIHSSEALFSSIGSAMLIGAHVLNMGSIRKSSSCSCRKHVGHEVVVPAR